MVLRDKASTAAHATRGGVLPLRTLLAISCSWVGTAATPTAGTPTQAQARAQAGVAFGDNVPKGVATAASRYLSAATFAGSYTFGFGTVAGCQGLTPSDAVAKLGVDGFIVRVAVTVASVLWHSA